MLKDWTKQILVFSSVFCIILACNANRQFVQVTNLLQYCVYITTHTLLLSYLSTTLM